MRPVLAKVVLFCGITLVSSVLLAMLWYPGTEEGSAFADILIDKANPSRQPPCIFPQSADGLSFLDRDATAITYDLRRANAITTARRLASHWNSD